jgi:hypothetical protein
MPASIILWLSLALCQQTAAASSISEVASNGLVLPTAVAPYGNDQYVVADAALQRIFIVANGGATRVLAGGGKPNALGTVGGAFADGLGPRARFNAPQGIATDAGGNVYVADTDNHCIRKITADGNVSTLAGDPALEADHDGRGRAATFYEPRGITVDVNGDLLVADGIGVRRVSQSGDVHTLPLPVNTPLDVTFLIDENQALTYVISDINGLLFARSDRLLGRYTVDNVQIKNSWNTIGAESIGHPYSVAGYGSHSVVYTDRFTNIVRVIDIDTGYVRPVLPSATIAAQVSEPLGIRMLPDRGSVAIIDAARRRLSVVQLDADRGPFAPNAARAFPPPPSSAEKRIALIGNSMVWWATDWPSSIEGQAEVILNAPPHGRQVEVLPIASPSAGLAAQLSYVGEFCAAHMADVAALNLNSGVVRDSYSFHGPISSQAAMATWVAPLRAAIAPIAEACRNSGVRFVVVINPLSDEASSSEDGLRRLLANELTTDPDAHATYLAALRGFPIIDLWPAFLTAEAANGGDHPALYLTADNHLSAAGRTVFATAFAEAIERIEEGA